MYLEQDKLLIQKLKIILNSNIFLILLIITSSFFVIYKINNIKSKYNENTKYITGIVIDIKENKDKIKITIKAKENVLVYYYNSINLKLGDIS